MNNDNEHICVNCQLARALPEWRDAGGPVEDVVEAIADVLHAALDDIFGDDEVQSEGKAPN